MKNLSLEIKGKTSVALVGQSGSGKSVLMRCILGLCSWNSGTISVGPYSVGTPADDIKRLGESAVVFQSYALFNHLTVGENISFGSGFKKEKSYIKDLLEAVGLPPYVMNFYPEELSGGMKRRVGIARAIGRRPRYLFLDEPTEGLDPILAKEMTILLRNVIRELQSTTLTITHDLRNASLLADTVMLLDQGHIAWQGSPEAMMYAEHPTMNRFVKDSFS